MLCYISFHLKLFIGIFPEACRKKKSVHNKPPRVVYLATPLETTFWKITFYFVSLIREMNIWETCEECLECQIRLQEANFSRSLFSSQNWNSTCLNLNDLGGCSMGRDETFFVQKSDLKIVSLCVKANIQNFPWYSHNVFIIYWTAMDIHMHEPYW